MDRRVATVGGVSIILGSAAVLHCVSLAALQSARDKCKLNLLERIIPSMSLHCLCVQRRVCVPGHSLYLEPLLYAVGQGLLVVVFTDSGQNSFLVGFILITAGINLA